MCLGARAFITLLLIGAAASISGRAYAFRTGSDLPELGTTSPVRWTASVVEFSIGGDIPRAYALDGIDSIVREAMAPWNVAACGTVTLRTAGATATRAVHGDGRNSISFIDTGWDGLAEADAAAATDVIYEHADDGSWHIVEADIYLNAQYFTWGAAAGANGKQLLPVLRHELGHALGLLHPCELEGAPGLPACGASPGFQSSIMYPAYTAEAVDLSSDDRAGLCFLYGCTESCSASRCVTGTEPECPPPACGTEESCRTPLCLFDPACLGSSPLGDPCTKSMECASGFCAPDGFCREPCPRCENGTCGVFRCETETARPMGSECRDGSDCLGSECLAGAEPRSVCTRSCTAAAGDCPSGWACETVDSNAVCVPRQPAQSDEGCACRLSGRGGSAAGWQLPWLLFALFHARRFCRLTARVSR